MTRTLHQQLLHRRRVEGYPPPPPPPNANEETREGWRGISEHDFWQNGQLGPRINFHVAWVAAQPDGHQYRYTDDLVTVNQQIFAGEKLSPISNKHFSPPINFRRRRARVQKSDRCFVCACTSSIVVQRSV